MENKKLQSTIESILFISGEPIKKTKIAKITESTIEDVDLAVDLIRKKYLEIESGLEIFSKGEEIQLSAKSENAFYVEKLLKNELQDSLSIAALEVVSIIAYRGPISKGEIEIIRGVNCSYTIRNLLLRGLIERNDNPRDSRGYLYSITFDFLKKLGVNEVKKLPEYDILSIDKRIEFIEEDKENKKDKE